MSNDPQQAHASRSTRSHERQVSSQSGSTTLLIGIALILFLSRWFVPAEATPAGTTLWIVSGWLLLWPLWTLTKANNSGTDTPVRIPSSSPESRIPNPESRAFFGTSALLSQSNLYLLSLTLLILGHVLSGLYLISWGEGNRRAALNMLWEWIALGVTARLFYHWRIEFNWRPSLPLLLSCIAALALLGMYQYFIFYPQTQRRYYHLVETSDHRGLADLGIPSEEPARSQFLDRLLHSNEPFGFFALANTFAGVLGVGFVLYFALVLIAKGQRQTRYELFAWVLITLFIITVAFFATNSRTAWAGMFVGFGSMSIFRAWHYRPFNLSRGHLLAYVIVTGSSFILLAYVTMNSHLMLMALKSLRYRFEYWSATWELIQQSPHLGHLGNFRQEYLRYKLPASSEEISDPHNLVLDVCANGGLIAFLGLSIVIVLTLWQLRRPILEFRPDELHALRNWKLSSAIIALTTLAAFLIPVFLRWNYDERILLVGLAWGAIFAAWVWLWRRNGQMPDAEKPAPLLIPNVWLFSWLGLTIHLLGAGGIQMPAISGLWLLLSICALPCAVSATAPLVAKWRYVESALSLVLLILFTWSTLLPVQQVRSSLADLELSSDLYRNYQLAQSATQADSLDPEPARLLTYTTYLLARQRERSADDVLSAAEIWFSRDPHSASVHRQIAEWLLDLPPNSTLTATALSHLQTATRLAPTNVFLWAKLFEAGQSLLPSDTLRSAAQTALVLHEQNERLGHTDKLLPNETLTQLRSYLQTRGDSSR